MYSRPTFSAADDPPPASYNAASHQSQSTSSYNNNTNASSRFQSAPSPSFGRPDADVANRNGDDGASRLRPDNLRLAHEIELLKRRQEVTRAEGGAAFLNNDSDASDARLAAGVASAGPSSSSPYVPHYSVNESAVFSSGGGVGGVQNHKSIQMHLNSSLSASRAVGDSTGGKIDNSSAHDGRHDYPHSVLAGLNDSAPPAAASSGVSDPLIAAASAALAAARNRGAGTSATATATTGTAATPTAVKDTGGNAASSSSYLFPASYERGTRQEEISARSGDDDDTQSTRAAPLPSLPSSSFPPVSLKTSALVTAPASSTLSATTSALTDQLERYRHRLVLLEEEVSEKNALMLAMEKHARDTHDSTAFTIRQLEGQLAEARREAEEARSLAVSRAASSETSVKALSDANARLEAERNKYSKEALLLQSEVAAARGRQMEAEAALSRYTSTERDAMQQRIAFLTTENNTIQQLRRECEQLRGLRDDCASLRQTVEDTEKELATERSKRRDGEKLIFSLEQKLATEEGRRRQLEADLRSNQVLAAEKGAAEREVEGLMAANALLRSEVEGYRRAASLSREHVKEADGAKEALMVAVQGQLLRIRQAIQHSYHDAEEMAQRAALLQQRAEEAALGVGSSQHNGANSDNISNALSLEHSRASSAGGVGGGGGNTNPSQTSAAALDSAQIMRAFMERLDEQLRGKERGGGGGGGGGGDSDEPMKASAASSANRSSSLPPNRVTSPSRRPQASPSYPLSRGSGDNQLITASSSAIAPPSIVGAGSATAIANTIMTTYSHPSLSGAAHDDSAPPPLTLPDAPLRPLYKGITALVADIIAALFAEKVVKGKRLSDDATDARRANVRYQETIRQLTAELNHQVARREVTTQLEEAQRRARQYGDDNNYLRELCFGQMRHLFEDVLGVHETVVAMQQRTKMTVGGPYVAADGSEMEAASAANRWREIIIMTADASSSSALTAAEANGAAATSVRGDAVLNASSNAASRLLTEKQISRAVMLAGIVKKQQRDSSLVHTTAANGSSSTLEPHRSVDSSNSKPPQPPLPPVSSFTDKTWRYLWEHLSERITTLCAGDGSYTVENSYLQTTVKDLSVRLGEYKSRLDQSLHEQQQAHQQAVASLHLQHEEEVKRLQRLLAKARESARTNEAAVNALAETSDSLKHVREMYSDLKEAFEAHKRDAAKKRMLLQETQYQLDTTATARGDYERDNAVLEKEVGLLRQRVALESAQTQHIADGLMLFVRAVVSLQHSLQTVLRERNAMLKRCKWLEQGLLRLQSDCITSFTAAAAAEGGDDDDNDEDDRHVDNAASRSLQHPVPKSSNNASNSSHTTFAARGVVALQESKNLTSVNTLSTADADHDSDDHSDDGDDHSTLSDANHDAAAPSALIKRAMHHSSLLCCFPNHRSVSSVRIAAIAVIALRRLSLLAAARRRCGVSLLPHYGGGKRASFGHVDDDGYDNHKHVPSDDDDNANNTSDNMKSIKERLVNDFGCARWMLLLPEVPPLPRGVLGCTADISGDVMLTESNSRKQAKRRGSVSSSVQHTNSAGEYLSAVLGEAYALMAQQTDHWSSSSGRRSMNLAARKEDDSDDDDGWEEGEYASLRDEREKTTAANDGGGRRDSILSSVYSVSGVDLLMSKPSQREPPRRPSSGGGGHEEAVPQRKNYKALSWSVTAPPSLPSSSSVNFLFSFDDSLLVRVARTCGAWRLRSAKKKVDHFASSAASAFSLPSGCELIGLRRNAPFMTAVAGGRKEGKASSSPTRKHHNTTAKKRGTIIMNAIPPTTIADPLATARSLARLVKHAVDGCQRAATAVRAEKTAMAEELSAMARSLVHQTERMNAAEAAEGNMRARVEAGDWCDSRLYDHLSEQYERVKGRLQLEEGTRRLYEAHLHALASREVALIGQQSEMLDKLQSLALALAAERNHNGTNANLERSGSTTASNKRPSPPSLVTAASLLGDKWANFEIAEPLGDIVPSTLDSDTATNRDGSDSAPLQTLLPPLPSKRNNNTDSFATPSSAEQEKASSRPHHHHETKNLKPRDISSSSLKSNQFSSKLPPSTADGLNREEQDLHYSHDDNEENARNGGSLDHADDRHQANHVDSDDSIAEVSSATASPSTQSVSTEHSPFRHAGDTRGQQQQHSTALPPPPQRLTASSTHKANKSNNTTITTPRAHHADATAAVAMRSEDAYEDDSHRPMNHRVVGNNAIITTEGVSESSAAPLPRHRRLSVPDATVRDTFLQQLLSYANATRTENNDDNDADNAKNAATVTAASNRHDDYDSRDAMHVDTSRHHRRSDDSGRSTHAIAAVADIASISPSLAKYLADQQQQRQTFHANSSYSDDHFRKADLSSFPSYAPPRFSAEATANRGQGIHGSLNTTTATAGNILNNVSSVAGDGEGEGLVEESDDDYKATMRSLLVSGGRSVAVPSSSAMDGSSRQPQQPQAMMSAMGRDDLLALIGSIDERLQGALRSQSNRSGR